MKFELYSSKNIRQINTELTARMAEKGTKARPGIEGFVEKGGAFHLLTHSAILGIRRTTRLRATMERVKETTIIRGYVSDGMQPEKGRIVIAMLATIGALLALNQQVVLGLIVAVIGVGAYVPLAGDYRNSHYLLRELKRITASRDKPPAALTPGAPPKAAAPRPRSGTSATSRTTRPTGQRQS